MLHVRRSRALVALSVTAALMAAGCGSSSDSSSDTTAASSGGAATTAASGGAETTAAGGAATSAAAAGGGDLAALVDAAKKEGKVNLIALPDDVGQLQGHPRRASATSTPASRTRWPTPDASSAGRAGRGQDARRSGRHARQHRRQPGHRPGRGRRGLFEPYKPTIVGRDPRRPEGPRRQLGRPPTTASWRSAPTPRSCTNAPKTFADLKKPEYKGQVALNGDPAQGRRGLRRGDGGVARQRWQRSTTSCRASSSSPT